MLMVGDCYDLLVIEISLSPVCNDYGEVEKFIYFFYY